VADNLTALAGVRLERGRLEDAENAYREAIAHYAALPPGAHGQSRALGGLGFLYLMSGRHAEAEAQLRQSVSLIENRLGPGHWRVALELTTLASTLRPQGRLDEAEAALRRALSITPRRPQDRAITLGALATLLRERGDLVGAAESQREALGILEAAYGESDPVTVASRTKLVGILRQAGRSAEADRLGGTPAAPAAGHAAAPSH
jgi:tetratricopeptide (TPR) repeat protein